jgi:hypothetical protein
MLRGIHSALGMVVRDVGLAKLIDIAARSL